MPNKISPEFGLIWKREEAFEYLEQSWKSSGGFQARYSLVDQYAKAKKFAHGFYETPYRELWSSYVVLDLLFDFDLARFLKRELIDALRKNCSASGQFHTFEKGLLLPADIDSTGLAIASLYRAKEISEEFALNAIDLMLKNTDAHGVMRLWQENPGAGHQEIDAVACCSALFAVYLLQREDQAKKTEDFVYEKLNDDNYESFYFPKKEIFYFMAARLLPHFPQFRKRFLFLIRKKIMARNELTASPLELALRVAVRTLVELENSYDREQLIKLQNEDGSWDEDLFARSTSLGKTLFFGSREFTTAFAIRALCS